MEKKYSWHKIAETINEISFNANGLAEVQVDGKTICVALKDNKLQGCAQKCPHASALLVDGYVDAAGNIVCPLHRYKFSLQNGRNVSGEGYFLKLFPVETRADGIFVGIVETGLFNWLK
ncbi:MAG TPA: Rieske 2Fe-2S domain-containing protein [Ferruginibacter sp.]|jgi:nitrite reductase/ring-hydroxylating ferredoxin subunit|nr:Rieske 2Fe-2S domain-containing protein [Ferruginibacter sp.]